jgi:hypothetical protein
MFLVQDVTVKMRNNSEVNNEKLIQFVTASDFYIGKYGVHQKE